MPSTRGASASYSRRSAASSPAAISRTHATSTSSPEPGVVEPGVAACVSISAGYERGRVAGCPDPLNIRPIKIAPPEGAFRDPLGRAPRIARRMTFLASRPPYPTPHRRPLRARTPMKTTTVLLAALATALFTVPLAVASSHREAPFITKNPKIDATDFYMFRSYEPGREEYVTLIANYIPLQAPYGGPNYFALDPEALYEIHVDNDGDAQEDITFQFRFTNALQDFQLPIGPVGNQKMNSIPIVQKGGIAAGDTSNLNVLESYSLKVVFGDRRTGM